MKINMNSYALFRAAIVAIAAIALVALPASASAQAPAADQYTPTVPDGGGGEPQTTPGAPPPAEEPTGGSGSSGSDNGGASGSDETGTTAATPTTGAVDESATTSGGGGNGGGSEAKSSNGDERALQGIAAGAESERSAASAAPSTDLLRSDSANDAGLGIFLWVVLGLTLLWAVATALRRRRDSADASSGHVTRSGQAA